MLGRVNSAEIKRLFELNMWVSRSQFFTIWTDPKPVNNLFFFFCVQKNCFNFCKHKDKISRERYRGPWADIGESCPR